MKVLIISLAIKILLINYLLNQYEEGDLVIENKEIENEIGFIRYPNENKLSRYYPDIYIKSENKIIEVKSEWTFKIHKKLNLLKQKACIENGINHEFMIITNTDENQFQFYNK